jgi:subtilisin-like proprotein convertase family protein
MIKNRSARMALLVCAGLASLGLLAGATPAAAKTKKKVVTKTATVSQCVNLSSPFLDASTPAVAAIPVNVPPVKGIAQSGVVSAVTSAGVRITHTFDGDVVLSLVSPGGRFIALSNNRGGSGNDFGTGATNCGGALTTFSDTAGTAIGAGTAPFAGSFRPEQPLATAVGGPAAGNWVLIAQDSDSAGTDEGILHAFSINVTYLYKAVKKIKKK